MPTIKLTEAEYQQTVCDIENSIEEFEQLSSDIDYYVTDMPDRLRTVLQMLTPEDA